MTTNKAIALGCGALALVCLLVGGVIAFFFYHVTQDAEGISIAIESPTDVFVGDTFDMKVVVTNERSKGSINLTDIDIADDYLSGFIVVRVSPKEKSTSHDSINDCQTYTFDKSIAPGSTMTFTFTLRAESEGLYRGDVDVYDGLQFTTTMAQTSVKEQP